MPSVDSYIDKFLTIIVLAFLVGGTAASVLSAFTQISSSGIFLASVIATLLGILFGVYILKSFAGILRSK